MVIYGKGFIYENSKPLSLIGKSNEMLGSFPFFIYVLSHCLGSNKAVFSFLASQGTGVRTNVRISQ